MFGSCRRCGGTKYYMQSRGMQVGLYCSACGCWVKWVGKKDINNYRNKGIPLYPQGQQITLSNAVDTSQIKPTVAIKYDMGLESNTEEDTNPVIINSPITPVKSNDMPFGSDPSIDIEAEVERRVAEELAKRSKITVNKDEEGQTEGVGEGFCPICDGNPLTAESESKVEVSIYSGVLAITDKTGAEILGLYRLKRCPNCGKIF